MVKLVPISQKAARAWVTQTHRHMSAPQGDLFRVGLKVDAQLVALGVAGRPCRMLQDGCTVEITRIASLAPSAVNACTRLYGALRRAGEALGYERFITYTRFDEPGTSPKAAGFEFDGYTKAEEWTRPSRSRRAAEQPCAKMRWIYPSRASGLWDDVQPGADTFPMKLLQFSNPKHHAGRNITVRRLRRRAKTGRRLTSGD